jgi:chromosome segregation ATPase
MAAIYEKYKTYIIVAIVAFGLGFCCSLLSSRGQLQSLRDSAKRYEVLYQRYQTREAEFTKRLTDLQNQLTTSRRTAAELRESIKRSSENVDSATVRTERIGNAVEGLERTVRAVEKGGRIKD